MSYVRVRASAWIPFSILPPIYVLPVASTLTMLDVFELILLISFSGMETLTLTQNLLVDVLWISTFIMYI